VGGNAEGFSRSAYALASASVTVTGNATATGTGSIKAQIKNLANL